MKFKLIESGLLTFLLFGFCDTSSFAAPTDFTQSIRRAFSHYVKDPVSTQIEITSRGKDAVCGRYNSKNSYGAYTGFDFFTFEPSSGDLFLIGKVIRKSGRVEDSIVMAKYDGTDFAELERHASEARAFFDMTANKIRGCSHA